MSKKSSQNVSLSRRYLRPFIVGLCLLASGTPAGAHGQMGTSSTSPIEAEAVSQSSIVDYMNLVKTSPHLFAAKGDWHKGEIEILPETHSLFEAQNLFHARYAKKMSASVASSGSRAGIVLEDPYILVVREAVRFPNGKLGLYNRKITRSTLDGGVAGAFCLPVLSDGRLVVVKEFRHQERRWRLSIPGGFRDPGETSAEAAKREAAEETGYALDELHLLGQIDAEGEDVPFFIAPVKQTALGRRADEGEALGDVLHLSLAELKKAVVASGYEEPSGTRLGLQGNLGTALLMVENYFNAVKKKEP